MGDHDQTVPHDEDAHGNIPDDGRTLRPARTDEYVRVQVFRQTKWEAPNYLSLAYVYRGEKLLRETAYVDIRQFSATQFESLYSSVVATGHFEGLEPSFAPVVDDGWRVIGHVGWIDGYDIYVPYDTLRKGSTFWYALEQRRLGESRQKLRAEADKFDQGPYPNSPFHPVTTSSPPVRSPVPCVPPATKPIEWKPTQWDDARRGPLKDKSIEDTYRNDLNYFLKGGGKASVGFKLDSDRDSYLDLAPPGPEEGVWGVPNAPFSSGYRFLVLVSPDGGLQSVLEAQIVPPKMYGDRALSIAFEAIDIAFTLWTIIDIVTIPVALFRLGAVVARKAAIRAVEVVIEREAKASLELAMQEAKRELLEAGSAGEAADAKAGLRGVSSELRPMTEEEFEAGARRGVSAIDRGRGARPFYSTPGNRVAAAGRGVAPSVASSNMNIARETAGTGGIRAVSGVRAADGSKRIVVEGSVRKSIARKGFEKKLVSGSDLGLPTYERLHLWGPRLGDEAAEGLWLGPGKLNIGEQARVEKLLQDLWEKAEGRGETVRLRITGATYPPEYLPINLRAHDFLSEATYEFNLEGAGIKPLSGRIKISIGPPPNGSIQTLGAAVLDAMLKAH